MNARSALAPLLLCLALATPLAGAQEASHWSLDAVLDSRTASPDGLPVLAVSPGGAAERMGIRSGDRILSINGRSLATAAAPASALDAALQASAGRAEVILLRNDQRMRLQGALADGAASPGLRGCGYASDSDPTPRASEGVYTGEITQIDGRSTPLVRSNRLRLAAGSRVLVVRESIPATWFTGSQNLARSTMKRRLQARAYKALVIDVAPDMRYSVGTRLLRDKLDSDSIRANAYWEPVVFATRVEACR